MKYKVVAIRDRAADTFSQPMCVPSIGSAIRSFSDEINRAAENNMLYKHPEDYDLFLLGEFADDDASYDLLLKPQQLAVGKDVRIG